MKQQQKKKLQEKRQQKGQRSQDQKKPTQNPRNYDKVQKPQKQSQKTGAIKPVSQAMFVQKKQPTVDSLKQKVDSITPFMGVGKLSTPQYGLELTKLIEKTLPRVGFSPDDKVFAEIIYRDCWYEQILNLANYNSGIIEQAIGKEKAQQFIIAQKFSLAIAVAKQIFSCLEDSKNFLYLDLINKLKQIDVKLPSVWSDIIHIIGTRMTQYGLIKLKSPGMLAVNCIMRAIIEFFSVVTDKSVFSDTEYEELENLFNQNIELSGQQLNKINNWIFPLVKPLREEYMQSLIDIWDEYVQNHFVQVKLGVPIDVELPKISQIMLQSEESKTKLATMLQKIMDESARDFLTYLWQVINCNDEAELSRIIELHAKTYGLGQSTLDMNRLLKVIVLTQFRSQNIISQFLDKLMQTAVFKPSKEGMISQLVVRDEQNPWVYRTQVNLPKYSLAIGNLFPFTKVVAKKKLSYQSTTLVNENDALEFVLHDVT